MNPVPFEKVTTKKALKTGLFCAPGGPEASGLNPNIKSKKALKTGLFCAPGGT
jgi:hypothetical protein